MARGFWTCQRRSLGVKCGCVNANRYRRCKACGKTRPARKRPAHMSALKVPYDYYVALNGSETCGICGAVPKPGRRLNRDHEHVGVGFPRGLLCWRHNKLLSNNDWTPELLRAAAAYLERANTRRAA